MRRSPHDRSQPSVHCGPCWLSSWSILYSQSGTACAQLLLAKKADKHAAGFSRSNCCVLNDKQACERSSAQKTEKPCCSQDTKTQSSHASCRHTLGLASTARCLFKDLIVTDHRVLGIWCVLGAAAGAEAGIDAMLKPIQGDKST